MSCYTPIFLRKLKKIQSLAHRDSGCMTPASSPSPSPSPSFRAKFYASEEQQFKVEWERIQKVVSDLYASFGKLMEGVEESTRMPKGTLATIHDDVHMLLRSKAGSLVFDFIQRKILPSATRILYDSILEVTEKELENGFIEEEFYRSDTGKYFCLDVLVHAWKHFYSHILPDLEMIFADVNSHSYISVRSATLLAFRDGIVLNFLDELTLVLKDHSKIKRQIFSIRQMLLVLLNASEKCPGEEAKLTLEKVVAMAVSPYQAYHSVNPDADSYTSTYDYGGISSDDNSSMYDIDRDDSFSVSSCTLSSPEVERHRDFYSFLPATTLEEARSRKKTKGERKRSVSTSEELLVKSLRR